MTVVVTISTTTIAKNSIYRYLEIFGEVPAGYEELVSESSLWGHEGWEKEYKDTFKDWRTHKTNSQFN